MSRIKALRTRFALWAAGLFLAGLAAFGVYIYFSMARGLSHALDESLALVALQVITELDLAEGGLVLSEGLVDEVMNIGLNERGYAIRVLGPEGHVLQSFGTHQIPPAGPDHLAASPAFVTLADAASGEALRVYTTPVDAGGQRVAFVQTAQTLQAVRTTLVQLLTSLLIGGPLLVGLAGASGYVLAARALAPIDQITHTARRIAENVDHLSIRLNLPPADDEVGRLAATLDVMLARLDDSFQRERQFTAAASHELRTPLAAMQAILGVMRQTRRTPEEYEQALADLSEETDRLRSLTDNLLRLARGDTRQNLRAEQVDLSTLLRDVAESLRPLAQAKGLELACRVPDDLSLFGDRDELIRMLVNLLDNAIKYTSRGAVSLSAESDPDAGLRISVVDTGPGIPAEHLPHIFERFYRADHARSTPGAGLGLAIALDIAQAHGGGIRAASEAGQGTCFTIALPGGLPGARWPQDRSARQADPAA